MVVTSIKHKPAGSITMPDGLKMADRSDLTFLMINQVICAVS